MVKNHINCLPAKKEDKRYYNERSGGAIEEENGVIEQIDKVPKGLVATILTTWQGCSGPKTDPLHYQSSGLKEERRQVVV